MTMQHFCFVHFKHLLTPEACNYASCFNFKSWNKEADVEFDRMIGNISLTFVHEALLGITIDLKYEKEKMNKNLFKSL